MWRVCTDSGDSLAQNFDSSNRKCVAQGCSSFRCWIASGETKLTEKRHRHYAFTHLLDLSAVYVCRAPDMVSSLRPLLLLQNR